MQKLKDNHAYEKVLQDLNDKIQAHFGKNPMSDIKGFLSAFENQVVQHVNKIIKTNIKSVFQESETEIVVLILNKMMNEKIIFCPVLSEILKEDVKSFEEIRKILSITFANNDGKLIYA